MERIQERVFEVLEEWVPAAGQRHIKDGALDPSLHLTDDLGFHAVILDWMEFMEALEDEFEVDIPDQVSEEWRTVADIINYLETVPE